MSDDFRYNEHANALEDNLEQVLESHQAERAKEASENESKNQLSTEPPALERITGGHTASDEVRRIISEAKSKKASTSDLILEHRLGRRMKKLAGRGRNTVNEFLTSVKS